MKRSPRSAPTFAGVILLVAHASAQGTDSCTSATPIAGTGSFAVSTAGATDSPQQPSTCAAIHRDVWFAWTAPATTSVRLTFCGGASADTVVAVYAGAGCPVSGTQIACNDDSCGQQSTVYFNATAGNVYMLQIGAFSSFITYSGTFVIEPGTSPCGTGVGPDVITGDITSMMNFSAAGGLDAFTLGTTSCNVGSAVVNWSGPTQFHPVMGETFYKYKVVAGAGRMEQIGVGWLKHGFAALAGTTCCDCQDPSNDQVLGLGCSDPYSAGQAAQQSTLTPRWEVNAHTGVFPYPGSNPAQTSATARRTEVALSELEITAGTTRFYAECSYTTQDDAQAGNNNNNSSFKELVVTGGPTNFTFATSGFTHQMLPAIAQWAVLEPGVVLSNVQVPGDGLFVVGSHATNLGGGQYHYEFAVHNMNGDRACGSFTVPLPAGAVATNIGFHDVTYRNGDGLNNVTQTDTDWPAVVAGGAITWSSQTQAQNPNANAIRWSATYNFRFDANVPPQTGIVTLGLWKPGTPTAVSALGDVPGGTTGVAYCFGDGSGIACPCANSGAAGNGCANSLFAAGAHLVASGSASVASDTLVLNATNMSGNVAVFFQGASTTPDAIVDDGIGCVGGPIVRLGTKLVPATSSVYPQPGDALVSVRGGIPGAGGTFYYQCFYRNAAAAFCPPATSNRTNGVAVAWTP